MHVLMKIQIDIGEGNSASPAGPRPASAEWSANKEVRNVSVVNVEWPVICYILRSTCFVSTRLPGIFLQRGPDDPFHRTMLRLHKTPGNFTCFDTMIMKHS